jgi:hypothetical protein
LTTTPYARLLTSVNGDTPIAGARTVEAEDLITFSFESTVGWPGTPLARIEFYSYPEGWTGPGSPWTEEEVSVGGPNGSTITYTAFVHASNSAPATFNMPTDWGKYLVKLVVNAGIKSGGLSADMIDLTPGLEILSVNGLHDLAWQEGEQFSEEPWRKWQGDQAENLRTIDTALAGALALSSTTPQPVGTAAIGAGTTAARSDHVHAHGNQLGGSLHAAAVAGVSDGFMTAAMATKLDGITAGAAVASVSGNAPISSSGGTTPAISISAASAIAAGSMSADHYSRVAGLHYEVSFVAGTQATTETSGLEIAARFFDPSIYPSTGRTITLRAWVATATGGQTVDLELYNLSDAATVTTLTGSSTTGELVSDALTVPADLPNSSKAYALRLARVGGAVTDAVSCKSAYMEISYS